MKIAKLLPRKSKKVIQRNLNDRESTGFISRKQLEGCMQNDHATVPWL
jgi:hypothetical protein